VRTHHTSRGTYRTPQCKLRYSEAAADATNISHCTNTRQHTTPAAWWPVLRNRWRLAWRLRGCRQPVATTAPATRCCHGAPIQLCSKAPLPLLPVQHACVLASMVVVAAVRTAVYATRAEAVDDSYFQLGGSLRAFCGVCEWVVRGRRAGHDSGSRAQR
jgi:hypothetical protein